MPEAFEPFSLTQEAFIEIERMLQHVDLIPLFTDSTDREKPSTNMFAFCRRLAVKNQKNANDLYEVAIALSGLSNARSNTEFNSKAFVDHMTKSLPRENSDFWNADVNNDIWERHSNEITSALDSLTDDHPLLVSSKANSLANTHQNLLMSSRLITDVRPVFNEAGTTILEMVITHTLALQVNDEHSERLLITIGLDSADISELKSQCERAERKARIVAEKLAHLNAVVWPDSGSEEV